MVNPFRVHGSFRIIGADSEVENLELEQLTDDPTSPSISRIWYNTTEKRIKYFEGDLNNEAGAVIRYFTNDADISKIINGITNTVPITVINFTATDFIFGQPVYNVGQLQINLASATNNNTKDVIGLVFDNVITKNGGSGLVITSGKLTGTVNQWNAVTSSTTGLISGKKYFLDHESGKLTHIPNMASGYVCCIGKALSTIDFLIQIQQPIQL